MSQRTAIYVATALTAFVVIVVAALVLAGPDLRTAAAQEPISGTATVEAAAVDPALAQQIQARDAAYQAQIEAANAQLQQAYEQIQQLQSQNQQPALSLIPADNLTQMTTFQESGTREWEHESREHNSEREHEEWEAHEYEND